MHSTANRESDRDKKKGVNDDEKTKKEHEDKDKKDAKRRTRTGWLNYILRDCLEEYTRYDKRC